MNIRTLSASLFLLLPLFAQAHDPSLHKKGEDPKCEQFMEKNADKLDSKDPITVAMKKRCHAFMHKNAHKGEAKGEHKKDAHADHQHTEHKHKEKHDHKGQHKHDHAE